MLFLAIVPQSCSSSGTPDIGITMELTFDQPVHPVYAEWVATRFGTESGDEAPVDVHCDSGYQWSNAIGTYTIQWACGSSSAPWSFELSDDAQAIVEGSVAERGLSWTHDGRKQPQQAPHPEESAAYTWHGTYSGLSDGSTVTFEDELRFRHLLGPGGSATVTLVGTHMFKG